MFRSSISNLLTARSAGAVFAALLLVMVMVAGAQLRAAEDDMPAPLDRVEGGASLDHPPVADPAALDGAAAERVYRAIVTRMQAGYARSGDPLAWQYTRWTRHNRVPYRSHQHGQVFVNNYANTIADAYGAFDSDTPLPTGALIAKDSFIVTETGEIMTGPLTIMEKMPAGFEPENGDWRYLQFDADGTLSGVAETDGNDVRMEACVACHATAPEGQDRLFYVPPAARR